MLNFNDFDPGHELLARLKGLLLTSAVISAGSSGAAVLGLLQSAVIARSLGLVQFGVWSLMSTLFATVVAFVGFRVSEPLTRYLVAFRAQSDRRALQQLVGAAVVAESATLCLSAVLGVGLAAFLGGSYVAAGAETLALYALSLPCAALNPVFFSVARDAKRVGLHTMVTLTVEMLRLALLTWLAFANMLSIQAVCAIWLGSAAAQLLFSALLLHRVLREQLGFGLGAVRFREFGDPKLDGFRDFMRRSFAASSISAILKNADLLILGAVQAPQAVGLFRVAKSVAALLQMVAAPIGSAFYQDVNELLVHGARRGAYRLIQNATLLIAPIVLGATLCTAFFATDIIGLIFGSDYVGAAHLLKILLISSFVTAVLFWAHPALLALDQMRFYLATLAVCTASALPLYWLSAQDGPGALAWAVSGVWIVLFLVLALRVRAQLLMATRTGAVVEGARTVQRERP